MKVMVETWVGLSWYVLIIPLFMLMMYWRRSRGGIHHVRLDLPFFGHTWQLLTNPKQFIASCQLEYGNAFSVSFLGKRVYILCNEEIFTLTKQHNANSEAGRDEILYLVQALGSWEADQATGTISGMRVAVNLLLPIAKRLHSTLIRHANEAIEALGSEPLRLDEAVGSVFASTFGVILFGKLAMHPTIQHHLFTYSQKVELLLGCGSLLGMLPAFGPRLGKFVVNFLSPTWKARKEINAVIADYVRLRQSKPNQLTQSVLDLLADEGHTSVTIANALLLMVFATVGSTTRTAQQHLIHLLAQPNHIEEIRRRLDPALELMSRDELGYPLFNTDLPFMASALKESLRHFTHRLEGWRRLDYDLPLINGNVIRKGSLIAIDFPNLHFDQRTYGPDADEYKPFRFVDNPINNHRFLVFGFGKHTCPGRQLSTQLITLYMSTLLSRYDVIPKKAVNFHTNPYVSSIDVYLVKRQSKSD